MTAEVDRWIRLAPDFGHPSGLWGTPVAETLLRDDMLFSPEDFGISDELGSKIRVFNDAFLENFTIEFEWRQGFDVSRWVRQGDEIVHQLREELPEFRVELHFHKYGLRPHEN